MRHLQFLGLYNEDGWQAPAYVSIDNEGAIAALSTKPTKGTKYEAIDGWFIPGFHNSHSHTFQIAMAGLCEYRGHKADSFWTWRENMYQLALMLDPDQFEQIAAYAFMKMLQAGITNVVEFQYLHHDPKGRPYKNVAEMSERLIAAAETAGIALCLVPVFYKYSHFDAPALPEQRRFIFDDVDEFMGFGETVKKLANKAGMTFGIGAHSLRAAKISDIKTIFENGSGPLHMHISEQTKEVKDCAAKFGHTPIAYLGEHVELGPRNTLVHCTHASSAELAFLKKSGVNAALCPSTEGNLGDGIFHYREYGGHFSIGSDSNINLNPFSELKTFEYTQRLELEQRNIVAEPKHETGENLFRGAWVGGCMATGEKARLNVGSRFQGSVLKSTGVHEASDSLDKVFPRLIFGENEFAISDVFVGQNQVVKDGHHKKEIALRGDFKKILKVVAANLAS